MYTKISNPTADICNANTGQYLGKLSFDLPPDEEKKLLKLVNYGVKPSTLILLNVSLYDYPKDYVPPSDTEAMKREGVFKAYFTDQATNNTVLIEIPMKFNSRARCVVAGHPYYLNSVQCNDIVVESVNIIDYSTITTI